MEKYFPSPLVYKEWKERRWWLALALLVIVVPMMLRHSLWFSQATQFEWGGSTVIIANAPTGLFASFVFSGLAAVMVALDRSRGALWHSLSGPVARLDLLRVKFFFGLASIIATFVVEAMFFGVLTGYSTSAVIRWALADAAIQSSVYATVFMVTCMVGNVVLAAICGIGTAASPILCAAALYEITGFGPNGGLTNIAPLAYLNQPVNDYFGVVLWSVIWTYGCYVASRKLFAASNAENFSSVFIFPVLWKWAKVIVCCFIGFVVTAIVNKSNPNPIIGVIFFTLFTWLASVVWRKVTERMHPVQA